MKVVTASALLASAIGVVSAFDISFPNSNGGYWVANYTNTVNWKANSTDPIYFSVQLLSQNSTLLNGNFQIGNAIMSKNGSAQIFIDEIPTGTYSLLFVNSSNYQLGHPQVYQRSNTFEIKAKGTTPAPVVANTNDDPNSSSTEPPAKSPTATLSSASNANTFTPAKKSNSAGVTYVNMGAVAGAGIVTLLVGLGVLI